MHRPNNFALTAAKEIVVAKMSNTSIVPCKKSGKEVAEFFEEIYNMIAKLATESDD